jgi:hypothetical protein
MRSSFWIRSIRYAERVVKEKNEEKMGIANGVKRL